MIKFQSETENYCLYYPDSLKDIFIEVIPFFEKKLKDYCLLFKIKKFRKIRINCFDDIQEFRNFIYSLRKEDTLPKYATGTYDEGMINFCITNDNLKNRILHTICHELFHIMYLELILNDDYSKRIVWYDEGMAQFCSGEYDFLKENKNFEYFFNNIRKRTNFIPNMNHIEHGNTFCNDDYNGYYLSYIAIRYLSEILSETEFKNLMANFDKIKKIGENVITNAFEYYEEKIKNKNI